MSKDKNEEAAREAARLHLKNVVRAMLMRASEGEVTGG